MKLWLLRPVEGDHLWKPWYDKTHGFVVRAETEEEARRLAQEAGGDEIGWKEPRDPAWTSPEHSTCVELTQDGSAEIVIRDFAAA